MKNLQEKLAKRLLRLDEIEVRISQVNAGGVRVLFYKDARVDQNILDEVFGFAGWKRTHQQIGDRLYCTVSVWDPEKQQWIEKQDVGTESKTEAEKGQASDSFKRACFNLGIGRELYTLRDTFIPASMLKEYSYDASARKGTCYDTFAVLEVDSEAGESGKRINSIKIGISSKGVMHHTITFGKTDSTENSVQENALKALSAGPAETKAPASKKTAVQKTAPAKAQPEAAILAPTEGFSDDEVILIGNCRGKKYGEVKDTSTFKSFLTWAASSAISYPEPEKENQFKRFKALALTA